MPKGDLRAGRALLPPPPHGTQFAVSAWKFQIRQASFSTSYSCEIYLASFARFPRGERCAWHCGSGCHRPGSRERRERARLPEADVSLTAAAYDQNPAWSFRRGSSQSTGAALGTCPHPASLPPRLAPVAPTGCVAAAQHQGQHALGRPALDRNDGPSPRSAAAAPDAPR